ncbi:hypothetical protein [Xanthomonas oryzae]|uniref:Secreted protein n=4 Tax=Xanthomonas oryzae TaxID=347 RepID=A0A854DP90_XANOO|nr:hypothetical protein [Xanthomonas oryzae]ACD61119.1 hypothetical protein PXO_03102 [Xanthomonas oryzae pv. oryzae PXO99A]AJQ84801.1 hypothetical protein AZ54_21180 [Xanthomonas oryzae pv. oryzae PXO86]ALZ73402.1 hypothetical protein APZ20_19875 [Xanthomonas oryzae pv. oryzae]AOS08027.1 hypothetical protein ATY43_20740 [Xanthomonas oryzae pv. oryzae]AOS12208.1 hypothetical protein ATY44_20040 [Xanthomonas oryzae pv. oryzae]
MRAALLTIAVLGVLPWTTAVARECGSTLGRGWPPAVGNYGTAVTTLLDGSTQPALALLTLPTRGVESAVSLVPGKDGADRTLRHSRADERVYNWVSQTDRGSVQFRTEQPPETVEIPILAALAKRLVSNWTNTLTQLAPIGRTAPVSEGEVLSFQVDGVRYSGARPSCGGGALLLQQAALLIEASEGNEKKRDKRWTQIESSLDELQQTLAGTAG